MCSAGGRTGFQCARRSTSPGCRWAPATVDLGWVLDPLSAVMLVMVTLVGLLIFIYSTGYMAHDENYTRFFCFLSLFAGAMLGVVIANSLLLLFMCWETGGPHVVSAHRLLVSEAFGCGGGEEGVSSPRASATSSFCSESCGCSRRRERCSSTTTARARSNRMRIAAMLAGKAASGPERGHGDRAADLRGRSGQERPASSARVAARCDGRPDACLGADSRGDDGCGRRLSDRARLSADGCGRHAVAGRCSGGQHHDCAYRGHVGGRVDGGFRGADRRRAERHQAHPRLLDRFAARLHDGRPGHGRRGGGHVPPDHACVLQGAAVHGRGFGDSRLPRRAGHSPHGRAAQGNAGHVRDVCHRHAGAERVSAAVLGLLEQGRDSRSRRATGTRGEGRFTCWCLARC